MRRTSAASISRPESSSAPFGQSSAQAPQAVHFARSKVCAPFSKVCAPFGQTAHAPQATHFSARYSSSGAAEKLSGLWHHAQCMLQPLKNTVVRMPGPSYTQKR